MGPSQLLGRARLTEDTAQSEWCSL